MVSESLFFAFFQKFISCHRGLRRPGSRFPIPRQGHKRIFERSSGPRAPLPGPLRPPLPRAAEGGRRGGSHSLLGGKFGGGSKWPRFGQPTVLRRQQTPKRISGSIVPVGGCPWAVVSNLILGAFFSDFGRITWIWAYLGRSWPLDPPIGRVLANPRPYGAGAYPCKSAEAPYRRGGAAGVGLEYNWDGICGSISG